MTADGRTTWFGQSFRVAWRYRQLTWQLARRNIINRYRGSYLGFLWPFLTPLLMLVVYTFVFSVMFKMKWGGAIEGSHVDFALTMLCGLIPFSVFAEVVTGAPGLIMQHPSYVKKIVFPLEILPVSMLLASLAHAGFSMVILLLGLSVLVQIPGWALIYLPVVLVPLVLLTLGLGWFFSALGVFVRDMGQAVAIIANVLFFLTPIFYPIQAVPEEYRYILEISPLSAIVDSLRCVVLWNKPPPWEWLAYAAAISLIIYAGGYYFFVRSKPAFADVI
ncbi:MAG: ABC transporter permease [Desulfomonile tiedjei]|uniref:Transport permease protein n=1 Tax=Desulfomonile tiedjei TaxID=2358 RepID=A0A9D6V4A7_9BACT|nr:ABC transporter permease [Desulfomonile tiedjei]